MKIGPGQELKTAGEFLHLEGGAVAIVERLQFANQAACLGRVGQPGDLGEPTGRERLIGGQERGFDPSQGRLAGQFALAGRLVQILAQTERRRQGPIRRQPIAGRQCEWAASHCPKHDGLLHRISEQKCLPIVSLPHRVTPVAFFAQVVSLRISGARSCCIRA